MLTLGTTSHPSCDITLAENDTLIKAPADLASPRSLPSNTPLLSRDQRSLENRAIQNLPKWKQKLAELYEEEAQVRDQIIVANNYIKARHSRGIKGPAMDGFRPECNDPQANQNHLVSGSSGSAQPQGGYPGQVTTPAHSSPEAAFAESNLDLDMIDASLGLIVPEGSMQCNIPLAPVATGGLSREYSLRLSPKLDGGARRRKRRRLSEKNLPVIHQNTASTTLTLDQSSSHGLPDSAAASKQELGQSQRGHRRNRFSHILFGQPFPIQDISQITDESGAAFLVPSETVRSPRSRRPASYPQQQRWRKSLGVSVKALREGFEKLKTV